ncbi:MAG: Uma2 family endonuclease [Calothrix sp. C42_A2020_038]|nr:Uma2 family endonuclease [Calothrix sp. C42_A2020_038]
MLSHDIFPQEELDSDEPQLETYQHLQQMLLLIKCLEWWWQDRTDFFAAGNLTIFYSQNQDKSEDFRGPDFFVVLDTVRKPRSSWIVWNENGKFPNVIIEILSKKTAKIDRGFKKELYQDTFHTPDYFWFDPVSLEFKGFTLVNNVYEPLQPNTQGLLWSQQLKLYLGVYQKQLRYFTPDGQLMPTPEESEKQQEQRAEREARRAEQEARRAEQEARRAEQEARRAEQEARRADQEAQRADQEARRADQEKQEKERLAAKLRELGIEPNTL